MNSFIKNIFTVFVFLGGFFVFSGSSSAEACEINSVNVRPNGNFNDYNDENRQWVYLDVQTQNCNTAPSQIIEIRFFDNGTQENPGYHLQSIFLELGQAGSLLMQQGQVDFQTSESNFTIPVLVGEKGNGSMTVINGSTYNFCGLETEIFGDISDCKIYIQFFNITNSNSSIVPIFSVGQASGPYPFSFECDYVCDVGWSTGCPSAPGYSPNPLPYGPPNKCSEDIQTTNVTTSGAGSGGITSSEYSTEPLAPLPGFTGTPNLGQWLESLFTILIVIAGLLALVMIVVGGITYLTSDSFGEKGNGKDYIKNAIVGLVLALGSWVILNTINPELAEDLNIKIPTVSLDGYEYTSPGVASIGSGCGPKNGIVCTNCQPIEGGIELKPEVASPPHNTIRSDMRDRLYSLQNSLSSNNISWRVTEAFRPTYEQHCSQCHYNGTCIDANFTNTPPTPQNIEMFVDIAAQFGLRAVYETNSQSTINQIQEQTDLQPSTKGGQGNYLLLNGITAPHFSVYNQ